MGVGLWRRLLGWWEDDALVERGPVYFNGGRLVQVEEQDEDMGQAEVVVFKCSFGNGVEQSISDLLIQAPYSCPNISTVKPYCQDFEDFTLRCEMTRLMVWSAPMPHCSYQFRYRRSSKQDV